jgi:uncharacterized RDD family membrane protein YckC
MAGRADDRGRGLMQNEGRMNLQLPGGVVFTVQLAGPVSRLLAWVVDLLVILALTSTVTASLAIFRPLAADLVAALGIVAYFVFSFGYNVVLEMAWRGQTVGKRMLGLRVLDVGGLPLTLPQCVLRNALRLVDMLPAAYLLGGFALVMTSRRQRLGDWVAGTVVVRKMPRTDYSVSTLFSGKFNSFRTQPTLVARLRREITPDEADVCLRSLLQRDDLMAAERLVLFRELRKLVELRVRLPEEDTLGLGDEQIIRNVAEILFCERPEAA